jgi:hypothetical protein
MGVFLFYERRGFLLSSRREIIDFSGCSPPKRNQKQGSEFPVFVILNLYLIFRRGLFLRFFGLFFLLKITFYAGLGDFAD